MKDEQKTKDELLQELIALREEVTQLENMLSSGQVVEGLSVENQILLATVMNISADAIILVDEQFKILTFNKGAEQIFGYQAEEVVGQTLYSLIPEMYHDVHKDHMHAFAKQSRGARLMGERKQIVGLRKNGDLFPAEAAIAAQVVDDHLIYSTSLRDITNRQQTETIMQESEERFRLAFENVNIGMCMVDLNGNLIRVNKQMSQIFGYSQKKLEKMTVNDIAYPADANVSPEFIQHSLSGEVEYSTFEKRYFHKEGHIIWGRISSSLVKNRQGEPVYFISHVQDITERKLAQEALKASESRATALLEAIPDMMFRVNRDGVFLDYQAERSALYAQNEEIMIGKRNRDISPPGFADLIEEKIAQTLESEQMQTFEYELSVPRQGIVHYEARMVKSGDDEVIAIVRDVTERRKLEQEWLRANKMESLGVLAGGIAHDFNNLLTGLYGNLELTKMLVDADHRAHKYLDIAESSMDSAIRLTSQLLTFAKGGEPIKEKLALKEIVEGSAQFALRGSNVKLQMMIDSDLWLVEADKGQLNQVIGNLVINAQEAMPMGGIILIKVGNKIVNGTRVVEIIVQDEGGGIPSKYLDKVFDPYFSTKQKGSGLGLASTYSIINKHNGRIFVESELNKGTTFTIQLPATKAMEEAPKVQAAESVHAPPTTPPAYILVLDDEEVVREALGGMLDRLGHQVAFAVDGQEAVKMYQNAHLSNKKFDFVITDLTIPGGMGGREAAQAILEINPEAKIIVSSRYANNPVLANYKKYSFQGLVTKPYRFVELQQAIENVLA